MDNTNVGSGFSFSGGSPPQKSHLRLERISRTDSRILANMAVHYSKPKGFVGRNICYAIMFADKYYGAIVGGSATLNLPGRDECFNLPPRSKKKARTKTLNQIVNNIFYHIEKVDGKYPIRNMVPAVLRLFREQVSKDWEERYGDKVIGFESLVELPRTGEAYIRDGWAEIGLTKGFTCKRVGDGGHKTELFGGKRVWDYDNLRPKRVFAIKYDQCVAKIGSIQAPYHAEAEVEARAA